uniref:ATP synthase mitochondrial F1 complex assembly factor 2 n=1 Tax=Aplanochytrium stocchinoi TaxID=215587 RepID=A0A7S3PQ79_9STRA|mmetsp:Transcript_9625/g.11985  ORF Transcript_9625/g.11985 Transcript_9625/m.11985 type:complete len:293 (-) Transcript_9625:211-1089(-)|eukprot:CAMPEP_0204827998 /NCGR_PEP_ID=MMETSP1346-20131115/5561_1 /ASSEMBLY_ACC=CAM_ASM_000771 /TAXON_ID=215587 /ORGANISM="Aplanochytrium stocchinoi, Strain GSBS06" /LENGTH=292 /DNA_ID=CAMNT_0051956727 /DNA_START=167 /DNA_END=1045 /DNA_ORIENTATION=-
MRAAQKAWRSLPALSATVRKGQGTLITYCANDKIDKFSIGSRCFSVHMESSLPGVAWKGRKKFYKKAHIKEVKVEDQSLYQVALDGRSLSTPHRNKLQLSNKALAVALAHEWDSQKNTIEPASMPLMTLCCTSIDTAPTKRKDVTEELMRFFTTDTVFYHVPENPKLYRKQKKHWNPLIKFMEENYGKIDLSTSMATTTHPEDTVEAVQTELLSLDPWRLTAVESLTYGLKSLTIPLALLNNEIDLRDAIDASRVEEEHNIEECGLVEGGHDVDRANVSTQIAAAAIFLRLL